MNPDEISCKEEDIQDWSDLSEDVILERNAAFIRGEIKATVYHYGPIVHQISKNLELLNRKHRIFTFNGQEGKYNSEKSKQRAYLEFLIEKPRSQKLISWLKNLGYIVFASVEGETTPTETVRVTYDDNGKEFTQYFRVCVTYDDGKEFTKCVQVWEEPVEGKFLDWVQIQIINPIWGPSALMEDVLMKYIETTENHTIEDIHWGDTTITDKSITFSVNFFTEDDMKWAADEFVDISQLSTVGIPINVTTSILETNAPRFRVEVQIKLEEFSEEELKKLEKFVPGEDNRTKRLCTEMKRIFAEQLDYHPISTKE